MLLQSFLLLTFLGISLGEKLTSQCVIKSDSGMPSQAISGTIQLEYDSSKQEIQIKGTISGFSTADNVTTHGFHIHEFGNLTNECKGAGGHFNPTGKNHGRPSDANRHIGDLGNIQENGGKVTIDITDKIVKLSGTNNVVGKAMVIHEIADNFTDPVGFAGGRLGCCIIEEATSGGTFLTLSISFIAFLYTMLLLF